MGTNFIVDLFKGHNWGSEHDPDTASCAPGVEQGGKYLMYQYSVSGYEHNNQVSVCPLSTSDFSISLFSYMQGILTKFYIICCCERKALIECILVSFVFQIFSSCSKRYIYNVIKTKGPGCFTGKDQAFGRSLSMISLIPVWLLENDYGVYRNCDQSEKNWDQSEKNHMK